MSQQELFETVAERRKNFVITRKCESEMKKAYTRFRQLGLISLEKYQEIIRTDYCK